MIVYVESNFVLELAALQEQHDACEQIIDLAEAGSLRLALPAFSVAEPYDVIRRRSLERNQLYDQLSRQIVQLARNASYEEQLKHSASVARLLTESGLEERARLDDTLIRLLEVADVIPVGAATLRAAIGVQADWGLGPQDSIVYASVVEHLAAAPPGAKCFLNRNAKDFLTPDILRDLAALDCRLISNFRDGLAFIRAHLGS